MSVDQLSVISAAATVSDGGVIGYPTEAVWGLGCDPFNQEAVKKILHLKNRPMSKGLILVAASISQLDFLLQDLTCEELAKLHNTWPGPVTWIIEDNQNSIPGWIKGDFSSVAVRVSDHSVVQALCNAFGGCLVSTSLNSSGVDPACSEQQSRDYFGDQIDFYMPGDLGTQQRPSTIVSLASGKTFR